ncbi:putative hydroxymethylpyrimidine transporter CytX [Fusibacter paucivorans]|uniref:Hydroxymethylpyrimidine transporter CytX n=1 Tax=Fusibacter paucivorans TaxID=76009 RepID=A0ABS5PTZ3_9FIRM|nr:putative hydroxymethylpyrimidine transporter CytX [Fusibacter paucivorans]MBS7528643.1 putative hydroxymethylpyrimidine transporter CytX [Fusibacter paucivorans]
MNFKEMKYHGLIWFGAAVSIAEILTGTFLAPLGFHKAVIAILLGHFIGAIIFYLAGYIGANTGKSAMDTVKIAFGEKGSRFFSLANILQLIGWTAIMIINGAKAVAYVLNPILGLTSTVPWSLLIGILILIWIKIGIKNLEKINTVVMVLLFVLTITLSLNIFGGPLLSTAGDGMQFGAAVELAIAMPLSWLPLIADYTRFAKQKRTVSAVSAITYFTVSSWMYIIGVGAVCFTGASDIVAIMLEAGLGIAAVMIVIASTVTTTYLDVYSSGVSVNSIFPKASEKHYALATAILGTALSIMAPVDHFEGFLYVIGSIFAPMFAILITDYFILKSDSSVRSFNFINAAIWLIGFLFYRHMLQFDLITGITIPVMIAIAALKLIISGGLRYVHSTH